jgi:hypothetical protein
VPIFILSRHEPGIDIGSWPLVTYVDDVETAMSRAKDAAGDKDGGSSATSRPSWNAPGCWKARTA